MDEVKFSSFKKFANNEYAFKDELKTLYSKVLPPL